MNLIWHSSLIGIMGFSFAVGTFSPAVSRASESGTLDLKILTYNIKGLPEIAGGYDSKHRFAEIGARLNAERLNGTAPKIVVLQEAFIDETDGLLKAAKYPFAIRGPNAGIPGHIFGSGLRVLSEFPIVSSLKTAFGAKTCATWDCFANKGAVAAEVQIGEMPFTLPILTTHLQAEKPYCNQRIEQMKILKNFIQKETGYVRPMIFAGDFNISPGRPSYDWWNGQSGLEDVGIDCQNARYSCQIEPGTPPQSIVQVDQQYFLSGIAASATDPGKRYQVEIKPLKVAKTFTEPYKGKPLSDHLGFEVDYEISWAPVN